MKLTNIFCIFFITVATINAAVPTVDPWVFEQRHELYEWILNGTQVSQLFGADNQGNLLWGLPIQLVWQFNSGRLETTTLPSQDHRIDEYSWWGNMNYYLSVLPYLSAMNKNLVPQVNLLPPKVNKNALFCTSYSSCPSNVLAKWDTYFDSIIQLRTNPSAVSLDQLLSVMWEAHTTSIQYSGDRLSSTLNQLPPKEKNFGNGWAHFVEVLDIVGFNTNYTNVHLLSNNLPPRMLSIFDFPPFIHDMTRAQNNVAGSMLTINDISKLPLVWNSALETLRALEKIPQCHDLILAEIEDFINDPVITILEMLGKLVTLCGAL